MYGFLTRGRAARRCTLNASHITQPCRFISRDRVFEEGDAPILLRELSSDPRPKLLRHPLTPTGRIDTHKGAIAHADIIGAKVNGVVTSSKGRRYMVSSPTLGEYVTLTPRLVAPIYPDDANLIVNLLDLHPDESEETRIFECGTGHGALTLHLARAVHGARGKAQIHTMDISDKHSSHAQKIIKGFRKGIYGSNITFHVGSPREFFSPTASTSTEAGGEEKEKEKEKEISHAILDMPSSHLEMPTVAPYLRLGGKLLLFTPSITQLIEAQSLVREQALPLYLERVIELGGGISGGREWSLKFVRSRASLRAEAGMEETGEERKDDFVVSCRPKVGKVVQGGGFVGLWTRVEERAVVGDADTGFTKGMGSVSGGASSTSEESSESEEAVS